MYIPRELPRGPTPEQYEVVRDVFEKTGILTVKDKNTGKWVKSQKRCGGVAWEAPYQNTIEYGAARPQTPALEAGGSVPSGYFAETSLVRAVYVRLVGTKKFPQGLAVGGYEVWVQDNFFVDTNAHSCVNFRADIWYEELEILKNYAEDIVHVTDEMWKQAEVDNRRRRDGLNKTQIDPAGALVEAFKDVLKSANERGVPADAMAEIARLRAENDRLRAATVK